jgi:transposase
LSASLRSTVKEVYRWKCFIHGVVGWRFTSPVLALACWFAKEPGSTRNTAVLGGLKRDLEELAGWLHELRVTHVATESTGVYWKPVWNVLQGQFNLLLVNAQHAKNVPARKTVQLAVTWQLGRGGF